MTKLFLIALALGTLYITTLPSTVTYPDRDSEPHFFLAGEVVHASNEPVLSTPKKAIVNQGLTRSEVMVLILKYAGPLHVKESSMIATISCESPRFNDGTFNPAGQSEHVKDGVRENSWGLAQIHLPDWPGVSRAEAQDPEFAIRFMAEKFATGGAPLWSCWRLLFE